MNKDEEIKNSKLIYLALLIVLILGMVGYSYVNEHNKIQQQVQEAHEKELNATRELERIKAEKADLEKKQQEEELKRKEEEARRIKEKYVSYHNSTFGFSIEVPKDFKVNTNDAKGIMLISPDGCGKIFALGDYKTDNMTVRQEYEDQLSTVKKVGGNITYHACGDDWYVVSWAVKGSGNYLKHFANGNSELLFVVMFPMDQQQIYAPMIEHMEDTFRRDRF